MKRVLLCVALIAFVLMSSVAYCVTRYEAEAPANTLAGGCWVAADDWASGLKHVGGLGNSASCTLTFNGVSVQTAGLYAVTMRYKTWGTRQVHIAVNGSGDTAFNCPEGAGTNVNTITMNLPLTAGSNAIKMWNPTNWAPDIDYIEVADSPAGTYTITASAGTGGSINPSGSVLVAVNSSQMFIVTPQNGYAIADVVVDGASQGAVTTYTFDNVTSNHTIAASFVAVPVYTITASAGDGGSITPSGAVSVTQGRDQSFTITPAAGYTVADVLVDGSSVGVSRNYTFNAVTTDHTIAVSFRPLNDYTISASAGPGGTISPSGDVSVKEASSETFAINANNLFRIVDVQVDGASVGAVASYTFSNIAANHSITATFEAVTPVAEVSYLGTDTATQGNWIPDSGKLYGRDGYYISSDANLASCLQSAPSYAAITSATIPGFWDGMPNDARSLQNPNDPTQRVQGVWKTGYSADTQSIILEDSASDNAYHQVSVYCFDNNGGSRAQRMQIIDTATGAVLDSQDLTQFQNGIWMSWKFKGSIQIKATRLAGDSALISGVFFDPVPTTHIINASAGTGGSISPSGAVSVKDGFGAIFTITPDMGYRVGDVVVDGVSKGAVTSYAFTGVTANHTINATFVQLTPAVVEFAGKDEYTKGDWNGRYGYDGYYIASDANFDNCAKLVPSYATMAAPYAASGSWISWFVYGDSSNGALQDPSGNGRIAAYWCGDATTVFDITMTDDDYHVVSLYCRDNDNGARSERMDVIDAATGNVLDSQDLSQYQNGVWLSWKIKGSVKINATKTAGYSTVICGVFFDHPTIPFSGKVTLEDGVTPVAGVKVEAISGTHTFDAYSAADGTYTLGLIAGEAYYIAATKDSYIQVSSDYYDVVTGPMTYDWQMRLINTISGTVKNAAGQPIYNAIVQIGTGGPAAITDINGKYSVSGITIDSGVSFYADALGYANDNEYIDTYDAASGVMTKDVTLTAKAETGVIRNGGFETIDPATGKPAAWHEWSGVFMWGYNAPLADDYISSTSAAGEFFSGTKAAKFTAPASGAPQYCFLGQIVPVIPGSTYNVYWKMKGDAGITTGFPFAEFRDADGNDIGDALYIEYGTAIPTQWTQYPKTDAERGAACQIAIPEGAAYITVIMGWVDPFAGKSIYVDDVVIDRVGPDPTGSFTITASAGAGGSISPVGASSLSWGADQTYTIAPSAGYAIDDVQVDGKSVGAVSSYTFYTVAADHTITATFKQTVTVKPVGVNNKSVLTDGKLIGKTVRVWGAVVSKGASSYVIDDGYGAGVTINGTTTLNVGEMAVVTGVVQANKSVTP